ncbi:MAG: hypothetical protein JST67_02330 [Bacteroidetes bacterium]|nr:hypothetical protein [Bacteroidota bacterium]
MQKTVFFAKEDSIKLKANAVFTKLLEETLLNTLSFSYPFDSLKETNRLVSSDKKVRLITWSISLKNGTFIYFGFVQAYHSKTKKYEVYELTDQSDKVKNPETYQSGHNKWLGMLYYGIIPCADYYTLLGWDGNNKITTRKYIDVLWFKKEGTPIFGKEVFKMPKKFPKRIVFEYNAQLTMSLRYNADAQALIFDHLAPKDGYLEGQYQFYGPDFSYDAFVYKHGKWNFEEEVDAKNPRNKMDNYRRNKTPKEKPVYAPK